MKTSPWRWIMPNMGGFSPAKVPRPRLPLSFRRRPLRFSLATMTGYPLWPAVMYTSSVSTSPLSSTGFFLPRSLHEADWSWLEHRQPPNPARAQFVHSKGSSPSNTNTGSRCAVVGDALQKSCRSDHQIVVDRHDTHIAGDKPVENENHAF